MYLSRLVLNPANRDVWRDLGDCHEMHRTIMRAFKIPDGTESPRSGLDVLYRLELNGAGGVTVYVQSTTQPDWSHLVGNGYLLDTGGMENPAIKAIDRQLSSITEGMELRFQLKANPTKKVDTTTKSQRIAGAPKSNGRRVALMGDEPQISWLARKGADSGFRLVAVRVSSEAVDVYAGGRVLVCGRKNHGDESDRLLFRGVVFDGHLVVTDREAFLGAVRKGIGSGKAYGFGLLSLAPA
ncbi:MAG: type I-E CRISPR-associated protein Cas6/Cse3/CasE [Actinobacteria bacterium]|nr:type I-E CRISPR-associated protein Cas6/Cse3/CasE [Actinomycetota bacterium]